MKINRATKEIWLLVLGVPFVIYLGIFTVINGFRGGFNLIVSFLPSYEGGVYSYYYEVMPPYYDFILVLWFTLVSPILIYLALGWIRSKNNNMG